MDQLRGRSLGWWTLKLCKAGWSSSFALTATPTSLEYLYGLLFDWPTYASRCLVKLVSRYASYVEILRRWNCVEIIIKKISIPMIYTLRLRDQHQGIRIDQPCAILFNYRRRGESTFAYYGRGRPKTSERFIFSSLCFYRSNIKRED